MKDKLKLFDENKNLVYWYAGKINKRNDEDIIQILNLALWKAACNYNSSKNIKFSTYACSIMYREYCYTFRDKNLKLNIFDLESSVEELDNNSCIEQLIADPKANIDDIMQFIDIKDISNEEISKWTERERNIYTDYYIENLPQQVLVEKYGVSQPQISRILRAVKERLRRKLKDIVSEYYIDY